MGLAASTTLSAEVAEVASHKFEPPWLAVGFN
jgi:hypothetical protein